jgi:hypothetical protein
VEGPHGETEDEVQHVEWLSGKSMYAGKIWDVVLCTCTFCCFEVNFVPWNSKVIHTVCAACIVTERTARSGRALNND